MIRVLLSNACYRMAHGFLSSCIVIAALLYSDIHLHAQLKTSGTDVNLIYDFYGTGPLLSSYPTMFNTTINLNNDNLIDINNYTHFYIPTKTDDYNNISNIETFVKFDQTPFQIDYNNDGLIDFLVVGKRNGTVYTRNHKGEYVHEKQIIMSPKQYMGQREDLVLDNYKSPFLTSGDMLVPSVSSTFGGVPMQSIDLNGDGLSDSYNSQNGIMFQTTKEGILISGEMQGSINVRDFNNDGLMDYVYYDKETFTNTLRKLNSDGSITEQKLLENVCSGGRVWCYDFDHDNDVDILIPVDYQQHYINSNTSYGGDIKVNGLSAVLLAENLGDGTFKNHEYSFEGKIYFKQCFDVDADGKYELYAFRDTTQDAFSSLMYGNIVSYQINGINIEDSPQELFSNACNGYGSDQNGSTMLIADFDLQGKASIVYSHSENYNTKEILANLSGAKENTAPNTPNAPQYTYDATSGLLKITWSAASDKESTSADLSYALRIGTEKEDGNMLYAHARPDGTRRNLLDGNCGFSTMRTMDVRSWPAGDYYISVQAVDPGHRGSAFSESVVFHKSDASADFILSYAPIAFGVGDTCRVSLRNPKETGCTYNWDLADGEIISQTDENTDMYVRFPTGGEKNICLQVSTANGIVSKITKKIDVTPVSIKKGENIPYNPLVSVDIDEDGTAELFTGKFYQLLANGEYGAFGKLWNTEFPEDISSAYVVDINMDGCPDVQVPNLYTNGKRKHLNIINLGDANMDVNVYDDYLYEPNTYMLDLDNDGDLDNVSAGGAQYMFDVIASVEENTDGNYQNWNPHTIKDMQYAKPIDYNKDGLVDFCGAGWFIKAQENRYTVCINNGDFIFSSTPTLIDNSIESIETIDADGDGAWDKFYSYTSSGYGVSFYGEKIDVEWGDGTKQSILCPDGSPFSDTPLFYDFDNNGCLDMCVRLSEPSGWSAICYFNKGHSYTMEMIEGVLYGIAPEYNYTGSERIVGGFILSGVSNSIPEAPTSLRSSQSPDGVIIEWEHSVDKETPAALMRYNISIKRKGATGENAYFISPLNMENDEVELPSPIQLLETNKITIPLTSIPAGEYEVKVQGVDRWYSQSKFSQEYDLTVDEVIVPGDVNKDNKANVSDVLAMGDYILLKNPADFDFNTADINTDGEITMSDMVSLINLVFRNTSADKSEMARSSSADYLSMPDVIVNDNGITLPVELSNMQAYTAFQMDIEVPEGLNITIRGFDEEGEKIPSIYLHRNEEKHEIHSNKYKEGKYRIIAYSTENVAFTDYNEPLLYINFRVSDGWEGDFVQEIKISNIIFTDSLAVDHQFKDITGRVYYGDYCKISHPQHETRRGYIEYLQGEEIVKRNEQVELKATPLPGYQFDYWYILNEDTGEHNWSITENPYLFSVVNNLSIDAVFSLATYNVTFVIDGEEYMTLEVPYGEPIPTVPEPTKEGYTFSGWSDIPDTMPARDVIVTGSFAASVGILDLPADKKVDIYSQNGIRVATGISVKNLTKELPKGIYIIEGKTYLIK